MSLLFTPKKLMLIACPILIFTSTICAQDDTSSVPIIAFWAKGDSYNFRITKIKKNWKNNEQTTNDSTTYAINFKVLDSTETDYTLQWSYQANLQSEYVDMFSKYKETKIIYKTSETGEFQGIENWKELSDMVKNVFSDLMELMAKESSLNQEEFKQSMSPNLQIYQSKEGIEQLVYKELQVFHFPFGFDFDPNKTISYEEALPNMIGGEPLKGEGKIFVEQ